MCECYKYPFGINCNQLRWVGIIEIKFGIFPLFLRFSSSLLTRIRNINISLSLSNPIFSYAFFTLFCYINLNPHKILTHRFYLFISGIIKLADTNLYRFLFPCLMSVIVKKYIYLAIEVHTAHSSLYVTFIHIENI